MTPGRRAGIRGRRDGRRPLRSRPCLAWLGDPRRAGATGIHAGISDQALFPSTPDPCFPNTSPILRPSSSADFIPGGGRARMQRPPLGRPRGSRQAVALGPPQAAQAASRAGGQGRPGPRRAGARWRAPRAGRTAAGRHPRPAHSPGYLWPVPRGRVAVAASERAAVPDHSFPRAARDAPLVTLGRASLVPLERAGTAPWTAVPGDRLSDIMDNTFLSSFYTCLLHVRRL